MPDIIAGLVVAVGGEVVTLRVDRRHRANEDHYAEAEPVRIRDVLLRRDRDGELTAVPAANAPLAHYLARRVECYIRGRDHRGQLQADLIAPEHAHQRRRSGEWRMEAS